MFDCMRSVGFGKVNSSSLVDLVLLLEIRIGDTVLDVGPATGPVILLVGLNPLHRVIIWRATVTSTLR